MRATELWSISERNDRSGSYTRHQSTQQTTALQCHSAPWPIRWSGGQTGRAVFYQVFRTPAKIYPAKKVIHFAAPTVILGQFVVRRASYLRAKLKSIRDLHRTLWLWSPDAADQSRDRVILPLQGSYVKLPKRQKSGPSNGDTWSLVQWVIHNYW